MMSSFWKGAFAPLDKHRDYKHSSFFLHMLAHGGGYEIDPASLDVAYDPITAAPYEPSDRYYFVDISLGDHGGTYEFLIHSEPDLSEPNPKRIKEEFDRTLSDPLIDGRDWFDYLDFDSPRTLTHPRVAARLEEEDPPAGPPRQRRRGEEEDKNA